MHDSLLQAEKRCTRILQINLGHGRAAQELMQQVAAEHRADMVAVSEQYHCPPANNSWHEDPSRTAAIYVPRGGVVSSGSGDGYVWVETDKLRLYSVYVSPNVPFDEYDRKLRGLEDHIRVTAVGVATVVCGDFNAKSTEWGSATTDSRGRALADAASSLGLGFANTGSALTFRRGGTGSIVDVTMADETTVGRVQGWQVLEDYSHSDHQYVSFRVDETPTASRPRDAGLKSWKVRQLDRDSLLETVGAQKHLVATEQGAGGKCRALMELVTRACDAAMPRRGKAPPKRKVYWWNTEVADLRKGCLTARRRAQRKFCSPADAAVYREMRKLLTAAIKRSKDTCWRELCQDVDRDPWGLPYKIVREKLRKAGQVDGHLQDTDKLRETIKSLFPEVTTDHARTVSGEEPEPVLFRVEELVEAINSVRSKKAPGLDGIPNEIVLTVAREFPDLLLDVYNTCLKEGYISGEWKRQRLVLVPKKPPADGPPSYRPLCMLSGFGKVLERLVLNRINIIMEDETTGLSPEQFGFRRSKSTVGAVERVVDQIRTAWGGGLPRFSDTVILVSLDVKNAFNTARWGEILRALVEDFGVPRYLVRMVESYFTDRHVEYHCPTTGQVHHHEMSAGVPQGSVLGPTLWNAMYDGLLRISLPDGVSVTAFADDIAIAIAGRTPEELKYKGDEALRRAAHWLQQRGLELAPSKTEAVIFSRRRRFEVPPLRLLGTDVPYSKSMRYLGVQLDHKLRFTEHVTLAAERASRVGAQLGRLMPNIGGPKSSRRKLLHEVVLSILLYGAPVFSSVLQKWESTRLQMARVQRRSCIRVISAYRTISEAAALVLSTSPPVDLLAEERRLRYEGTARTQARELVMRKWQTRWDEADGGRWTHRLIGNLLPWCNRKHGDLCYHLTQLLTGHGCFGAFLNKIGKEATTACHHCPHDHDDAEHTTFHCEAWSKEREDLRVTLNIDQVTVDGMIPSMLSSTQAWLAWTGFAVTVLRNKEDAERMRRRRTPTSSQ